MALPSPRTAPVLAALLVIGGCGRESLFTDSVAPPADLSGTVSDERGRAYPGVQVRLGRGPETVTDDDGGYRFGTVEPGIHLVEVDLPLATRAVSPNPEAVRTSAQAPARLSFVLAPEPVAAVLNLGAADTRGEVRDASGGPPGEPSTPLFAQTVTGTLLGRRVPIVTPLGQPVTRASWALATGTAVLSCDGDTSVVALEGQRLIPNGVYSAWLSLLRVDRAPGEPIAPTDVIRSEPLGAASGTENVLRADARGQASLGVEHATCLLTQYPAVVLAFRYHLTGQTYGPGPIPDDEEVTHLWVYVR